MTSKKKTYRISVYNRTAKRREFLWQRFTSKKAAQDLADRMNAVDTSGEVQARVVIEA